MDSSTIQRLNQINQQFYQITAESFDESRSEPWAGWYVLLPHLSTPLTVLDVGCGNGRLGVFLAEKLGTSNLTYYGIDSNPTLLDRARHALADIDAHFEQRDIIEAPPDSGAFGLVALFGMLHHVPGAQQRHDLLQTLAARVAPERLLAFAAWCFYDHARFRERIISWPDDIQVERHDYLLDWRRGTEAVRYCHYVDEAEHAALIAATGLTEVTTYYADGRTNNMNRYTILRRDTA